MGRAVEQRIIYKTEREETESTRQLCISGWSGLRGWQHGDGNSHNNTSLGECVEESERGDGRSDGS